MRRAGLIRWARARLGQRGFTLVELAIALAVIGLLLGASLIPLRALDEARQFEDERRRLAVVRDAIVGYTLRHRTRARTIWLDVRQGRQFRFTVYSNWKFHLPGGRPYLPCPDRDGDGFEDRYPEGAGGFVQGVEVRPDLTVTASISFPSSGPDQFPAWDIAGVPGSVEGYGDFFGGVPYGECLATRGAVPWRTLGIPPADGWGNRHTYFADAVFSNAIFGFDRQTIADSYDPRLPEPNGGGNLAPRSEVATRSTRGHMWSNDNRCPGAVCDGGEAGDCVSHNIQFSIFHEQDVEQCGWTEWDSLVLKAGTAAAENIRDGRKYHLPGNVTDGLPFVLVSHGPNGRFAVNHAASLNRPRDASGTLSPICNFAWAEASASPIERYVVRPSERGLVHEMVNGARLSPSLESCPSVYRWIAVDHPDFPDDLNLSFFVWEPRGLGALGPETLLNQSRLGFDDILLWMTREELAGAITGDIPPLPRMVIAYFP